MCSRYFVDDDIVCEIEKLVGEIDQEMRNRLTGDIYPSQNALVITAGTTDLKDLKAAEMPWGFLQSDGSRLLINARAETVLERRMFLDSVLRRRCAIPARGFYEWDADRNKATFSDEGGAVLYLAGFYNLFQGQNRFIILTTEANPSVRPVHDRMPLILEEQELLDWVRNDRLLESALKKTPPLLRRRQEYEQQRLFL